ncbi:TIGR03915 family putative DNA repair protein [Pseudomonas sp. GOM6]|uniref:TIGR03915 family putative DNA repair protein n=1 Tax=Pseudomonas sp. GOM6 TaxID=3036944 RepID=UPI0024090945|nr:TIGR03915 family putative DNA repair protein [Pseudomonas sp. GOM6]MDG1579716.1 TIGR03915 family putative DNA repair protein [Pseudomonas sp. GOM6]
MHAAHFDGSFRGWRQVARELLAQHVAPQAITWCEQDADDDLFARAHAPTEPPAASAPVKVPRQLLELLEQAARYRCAERWSLLYRVLWRVCQGERNAMLAGDPDGSELHRRLKAVRREAHHLHAFLRFQPCSAENSPDFVAWHEPAHDILPSASMHFAERMGAHSWLIATPRDGVYWDGQRLRHEQRCPLQWRQWAQMPDNEGQQLWLTYYESTFNPSRLNRGVLENNLPVRFWKSLPEGPLIPQLMQRARSGEQRHGQALAVGLRAGKIIRPRAEDAGASGSAAPDLPR